MAASPHLGHLSLISTFKFLLTFIIVAYPSAVRADIRNTKIEVVNDRGQYIDSFKFTDNKGSGLQLKATNISLLKYPTNTNLSQIGFVFSHKKLPRVNGCRLHAKSGFTTVYTLDMLDGADEFNITFSNINRLHECNLFFENCLPYENDELHVSMNVHSEMYNYDPVTGRRLYLSADKNVLTKIYAFFSIAHLSLVCLWIYILYNSSTFSRIHVVMLVVPFIKAWSLFLQILHDLYILQSGCVECWPSLILTCASDLLNWVPSIGVLFLIISGWSFLDRKLLQKDKLFLMSLVFQELLLESVKLFYYYRESSFFSYLFPTLWYHTGSYYRYFVLFSVLNSSVRFMRESGSIKCIEQFRSLFIGYFLYSLFTMVVDTAQFSGMLKESAMLVFYVFVGLTVMPSLRKLNYSIVNNDRKKAVTEPLLSPHVRIDKLDDLVQSALGVCINDIIDNMA